MSVHTGRLLLSTQDPFLVPDRAALERNLVSAGFLGDPLEGQPRAFRVGKRFLQLITFAGCSVQVELSANGDAPFCHIVISGPFEQPKFLWGRNTRPPRCPHCRRPLEDWKRRSIRWAESGSAEAPCAACGRCVLLWAYDWKEKAGFGRLFVQVEEIFPGEAIPTPELMKLLSNAGPGEWRHFYVQD